MKILVFTLKLYHSNKMKTSHVYILFITFLIRSCDFGFYFNLTQSFSSIHFRTDLNQVIDLEIINFIFAVILSMNSRGGNMITEVVLPGQCYPLLFRCADPWYFPKCGKLDCIVSDSEGLSSHSPLLKLKNRVKTSFFYLLSVILNNLMVTCNFL